MKHQFRIYHEFSNIIATIDRYLGSLDQSLSGMTVTSNINEYTKSIETGVGQLKALLAELRDRNHSEDKRVDAIENSVWTDYLQSEVFPALADLYQIDITFTNHVSPSIRAVMNLPKCRSICENLLSNAVMAGADRIFIEVVEQNHAVDLIIRDNGQGMTEDEIKKLGLGYSTKNDCGHGQGMRIVRHLAAEIAAVVREPKSIPGIGSEFQISFLKVGFSLEANNN